MKISPNEGVVLTCRARSHKVALGDTVAQARWCKVNVRTDVMIVGWKGFGNS